MSFIKMPSYHILYGVDQGKEVRELLELDTLDLSVGIVHVLVSQSTLSLTPSFFLGCFKESIKTLGETQFREKYKFYIESEFHSDFADSGILLCVEELDKEKKGEIK